MILFSFSLIYEYVSQRIPGSEAALAMQAQVFSGALSQLPYTAELKTPLPMARTKGFRVKPDSSGKKIHASCCAAFFLAQASERSSNTQALSSLRCLVSLLGWLLDGPMHGSQNLPHVAGVELDARHLFNDFGHPRQGPQMRRRSRGASASGFPSSRSTAINMLTHWKRPQLHACTVCTQGRG